MNKKPLILRSVIALVVLAVFMISMYPLGQRDFYECFKTMLKDGADPQMAEVVDLARKKGEADKSMYASTALEEAAREKGVALADHIKPAIVKTQKIANNRDVISHARKISAGSIRLGIDLNGGAEFLLELEPLEQTAAKNGKASRDIDSNFERYRDIAIETLRKRLESQSIFESEISPAGGKFISLRVPVVSKEEKVKLEKLIKMSARLSFCLVHPDNAKLVEEYMRDPKKFQIPDGYRLMESTETVRGGKARRLFYLVAREPEMDGRDIVDAFPSLTQFGQREIILNFNADGAQKFGEVTAKNVGRQLAIILDNNLYSAPNIKQAIPGGTAQITGDFSREDAETISNALVSGSVPFKVNVQAQYDIDATIGKETVRDGLWSGIAGTILVMLFMVFYYRRAGIVADISLIVNALLMLGALAAFDVTLTLPGIAGIILTIGMAVDANVLIYERIREEIETKKTVINAVEIGFSKAFSAIFDSNLTTLFVALILLWQGTGAIKGFAMTLAIGIFTTMFTAVFLTHLLFDLMTRFTTVRDLPMRHLFRYNVIDFLSFRKVALTISTLLIAASLITGFVRGKDMLGVDFTGGTQIELDYANMIPAEQIGKALAEAGYDAKVTYKTPGSMTSDKKKLEILCRENVKRSVQKAASDEMAQITGILNKAFPNAKYTGDKQSQLGALIGWTFTKSAILSLALAIIGMIVYMTFRFEFSYSVAANVAVIHDCIIAAGIYVMCGGEITLNVVAACLTLLGYSINDTIVNFDRIRENLETVKGGTYYDIINLSVSQTLGRTMLTSLTVLLVLLMQLAFGGSNIRDFVVVMLIGVIVGTYSTIYIASIIVDVWHRKNENAVEPASEPTVQKG